MTAFGFLGFWLRPADSIAILRPAVATIAMFGAIFVRSDLLRAGFIVPALLALYTTIQPFIPQSVTPDLRLYTKNLLAGNSNTDDIVRDIKRTQPDIVMLQEVSTTNNTILGDLSPTYPYQHLCKFSKWSGIALASRTAFVSPPKCSTGRALAAGQIEVAGQNIWAVSAHIPWPWPKETAKMEQAATDLLAELNGPIVIAGDFNTLPWTNRVKAMERLTQTRLAGPTPMTFLSLPVPLPIDFVLAPNGGSIERRPMFGSDHAGLIANVSLF